MPPRPAIITRRTLIAGTAGGLLLPHPALATAQRYWRLYTLEAAGVSGSGTANTFGSAEIELRTSSGGADQTGSGTATASSEFNSSFSAPKAVDNNTSTSWATANFASVSGTWWQYDFGAGVTKDIAEVLMYSRESPVANSSPDLFLWQSSPDGSTWTTEWYGRAAAWVAGTPQTFTRPATVNMSGGHRYWRLSITTSSSTIGGFAEILVYSATDTGLLANLAPMATASASSTYPTTVQVYWGNNANPANGWASNALPATYTLDFGNQAPAIGQVWVQARTAGDQAQAPVSGSVEYSDNGSTWTTVGTYSGMSWSSGQTQQLVVVAARRGASRGFVFP